MNTTWQRYLDLASGLSSVTQRGAETVVKSLVKQGEVAADRAEKTVDDLLSRSERNRKVIASLVKTETERAVSRLGLARQRDLQRLQAKVAKLESQRSGGPASGAKRAAKSATKTSAADKRAAAGRSPAAGSATATAAASTAKKAGASKKTAKSAGKKVAARKATAPTSAPTSATKKATARKTAAKTTAAAAGEDATGGNGQAARLDPPTASTGSGGTGT